MTSTILGMTGKETSSLGKGWGQGDPIAQFLFFW